MKARKKNPAAKNSYRKIPTAKVLPKKITGVENSSTKIFFQSKILTKKKKKKKNTKIKKKKKKKKKKRGKCFEQKISMNKIF